MTTIIIEIQIASLDVSKLHLRIIYLLFTLLFDIHFVCFMFRKSVEEQDTGGEEEEACSDTKERSSEGLSKRSSESFRKARRKDHQKGHRKGRKCRRKRW
jgi:hypothetical protein